MHFSAPIHRLKRRARLLSRDTGCPLHQALDRIAAGEGFQSWSHLASSAASESPALSVLSRLSAGDLVLLAARPGHGKTRFGLELALRAGRLDRKGYFFTLDYHERDVAERSSALGFDLATAGRSVRVDTSDEVSAGYVIGHLERERCPAVVVIDYLQLLDQNRTNPGLGDQIAALRRYVTASGAICAVISQIDRFFELSDKAMPDLSDVRLPNPLDLSAFDKAIFLHDGRIRMERAT
ncbi:DNA helicase [Jannaschia marina]|uniref:DNA helicase n=1 Tax=Jannaschia marina TaxID=2741674 RepID=UPI0015C92A66|nr:DNA helicase [Jannaschia marina]